MNECFALAVLALIFAGATFMNIRLGPLFDAEPASSRDTTPWYTSPWIWTEEPTRHPVPVDRQTEPVIGWRSWSLRYGFTASGHTTTWTLASPTIAIAEWRPRVAMRATCHRCGDNAPNRNCHCGIYAFLPGSFASYPGGTVIGEIKGWGRVIEHSKGWRAASAYPSSLCLICHRCRMRADWVISRPLRADDVFRGAPPSMRAAVRAALIGQRLGIQVLPICARHWDVEPEQAVRNEPGIRVHSAADVTARLLADYGVKEAVIEGYRRKAS